VVSEHSTAEAAEPAALCPACGEDLLADARFCEACGAAVAGEDAAPSDEVGEDSADGATGDGSACTACGAVVDADGYCTSCGLRALEPVAVEDRGTYAYATHRGRRHPRNEDAGALATTSEGWPILIVADGVSASPNPHLAAAAAVTTVADEMADRPFTGPDDLTQAVLAAFAAACEIPADGDPLWLADGTHPACTIVVAVATTDAVHVANVGDARAYVVTSGEAWTPTQLSTDDSVAALAIQEGVEPAAALTLPGGHAITAWLGADAPEPAVHVTSHPAAAGDLVLACSDGLWNYAPTDEALAERINATVPADTEPAGTTARACEELVSWAIDQGGSDNICVAIAPVPPGEAQSKQEDEAS
jgi:serine/threonine protein phosphatase PrpC